MPNLLPGGRPVEDARARAEVAGAWHVDELPSDAGRDTSAMLAAALDGSLDALLVGGVELADLPDPEAARLALDAARFVVSLELRHSDVTERADVVFPVAPVAEKAGSFVNWEGRLRPFEPALPPEATADMRVLAALADEVGIDLTLRDAAGTRAEIMRLGAWEGSTPEVPDVAPQTPAQPAAGTAVLTGWRMLLGTGAVHGRLQDGEPHLAGTARPAVARLSPASAEAIGAVDGDPVIVAGAVTLPLEITAMPDGVVWAPLGLVAAQPGSIVDIARAGDPS